VRDRLSVIVSEVGELDSWQRAELGVAVASGDRAKALELIDEVVRVAIAAGGAQIVSIAKDAITFDAAAVPSRPIDDRTGAGDKAQAQDDWVPAAWREEADK